MAAVNPEMGRTGQSGSVFLGKRVETGHFWEAPPGGWQCPSAGQEEQLWSPIWSAELRSQLEIPPLADALRRLQSKYIHDKQQQLIPAAFFSQPFK